MSWNLDWYSKIGYLRGQVTITRKYGLSVIGGVLVCHCNKCGNHHDPRPDTIAISEFSFDFSHIIVVTQEKLSNKNQVSAVVFKTFFVCSMHQQYNKYYVDDDH